MKNIFIKGGHLVEILVSVAEVADVTKKLVDNGARVKENMALDDKMLFPHVKDVEERQRRGVELRKNQLAKMAETCTHGDVLSWIKQQIASAKVAVADPCPVVAVPADDEQELRRDLLASHNDSVAIQDLPDSWESTIPDTGVASESPAADEDMSDENQTQSNQARKKARASSVDAMVSVGAQG
jgi:hypothetical protein